MTFDLNKAKNLTIGIFVAVTAAANVCTYLGGEIIDDIHIVHSEEQMMQEYCEIESGLPDVLEAESMTGAGSEIAQNTENRAVPASDDPGKAVIDDKAGADEADVISSASNSRLIDINHAGAAELQTLNGIGPSKADAIIKYRENYGGFICIEEIMQVKGIGEVTYNKIKDEIYVAK